MTTPTPPRRDLRDLDDHALWAALLLAGLGLFLLWQSVHHHTLALAATGIAAGALALAGLRARARIADALERRRDPPGPGVIVGEVTGNWAGARPRPFFLPWSCFTYHVLVVGPTGRGKTTTFIEPVLDAHVRKPGASVFFLDGKGERIDRPDPRTGEPGIAFDHVFCPDEPRASARWNPLAGPDPGRAAARFAAALYPEAKEPDQYYAASAVAVLCAVIPAMAYTGHGIDGYVRLRPDDELKADLLAHGVDPALIPALLREPAEVDRQLRWLPRRDRQDPEQLVRLIRGGSAPSSSWPDAIHWPQPAGVTIREAYRLLFAKDDLDGLRKAVANLTNDVSHTPRLRALEQIDTELAAFARLSEKERAGTLSNLRNRLGWFLRPPFLELCSTSDFDLADVCTGTSVAFLLPSGPFPDVAAPLGRVALAQFTQAVLSSTNPEHTKLAVLDEFHHFVTAHFAEYLNQARSFGGGAVMALQTIAAMDEDTRNNLLANPSTVAVTPGCMPFDADYFSRLSGEVEVERRAWTFDSTAPAVGPRRGSIRVEHEHQPRFTPTEVRELEPFHTIVTVFDGTRSHPAREVHARHVH